VKERLALTLATGLGVLAVACSKPIETAGKEGQTSRDIRLIEEPAAPGTVSNLEAGRVNPPTVLPEARKPSPSSRATIASPAPAPQPAALMADVQPESTLRVITQTNLPAPAPLVDVPLPAPQGPAPLGASEAGLGDMGNSGSGGGSRGPMILIRGGMGTDRDDCKIHGMGGLGGLGAGGGIAINRMAPSFRPGGGGSARPMGGGIRIH